ncbi:hypothetical protein CEUSTIGMA_g5596.t1 [Chlamydomonas eustigma]|uniref:Uncharacterized protein n=1 Tax=Chlamydomonas eustigma TaxID=1157962 RepID=A0A250X4Z4_9CHLO|nr:hypothetical protein CEUSTIGMA_g5596.t1 [Chlamydomonas eustigma]|eukprot:GAX78154.1 hypothetical protein CEUSTIGMA_g5596.t1 [Chlamydomonas eustigma]
MWKMPYHNDYTTSPVEIQDLPHDYSRSPLLSKPEVDTSAFVAYLWGIVIHVIASASITFAGAVAGGPGYASAPIVTIGLLMQLGHGLIGLLRGQGLETLAAPLLMVWPYAAVAFLGIPQNREDMSGIRMAAAICRRLTFLLMAFDIVVIPFSYDLSAHLVLDFPDSGLLTLFENPSFPHGILTPLVQLIVDTGVMYTYYDRVGIVYYQAKSVTYTFIRAFLYALAGSAYWWWIDNMQQQQQAKRQQERQRKTVNIGNKAYDVHPYGQQIKEPQAP